MFINSISPFVKTNYTQENKPAFKGLNPEVARNQLKLFLTQEIWSPKLKVKMPETDLEKEVLLEVLQNRLKLDKFTRLTNERFNLLSKINLIKEYMAEKVPHPDLEALVAEVKKVGNVDKVIETLDKRIATEADKNKPALDYFKGIEKLDDEYRERKLINDSKMTKWWNKINKGNINPDEKYSTKELIDIVTNPTTAEKEVTKAAHPLSKKELLASCAKLYEQSLRENVNIYDGKIQKTEEVVAARKLIFETYGNLLKKFPNIETKLNETYKSVENKFTFKVDKMGGLDVDIYPINEIWKEMKTVENSIRDGIKEVADLEEKFVETPYDDKLEKALKTSRKNLEKQKKEWLEGMKYSVKYEAENRKRMAAANVLNEYDYATSENKILKKHKAAQEFVKNNKEIPDSFWTDIVLKDGE